MCKHLGGSSGSVQTLPGTENLWLLSASCLQKLESDGRPLATWQSTGSTESGSGLINRQAGLAQGDVCRTLPSAVIVTSC